MKRMRWVVLAVMTWALCGCSQAEIKEFKAEKGGSGAAWMTSMDEAKKAAAEKKVPILVDFSGSDWCGWCIKLDQEVFSKPVFRDYAKDNLVLLLVDFPRRQALPDDRKRANQALAEQFGIRGFPTVLLLDATGKELARTGYRPGGADGYVSHLKELLSAKP